MSAKYHSAILTRGSYITRASDHKHQAKNSNIQTFTQQTILTIVDGINVLYVFSFYLNTCLMFFLFLNV